MVYYYLLEQTEIFVFMQKKITVIVLCGVFIELETGSHLEPRLG